MTLAKRRYQVKICLEVRSINTKKQKLIKIVTWEKKNDLKILNKKFCTYGVRLDITIDLMKCISNTKQSNLSWHFLKTANWFSFKMLFVAVRF